MIIGKVVGTVICTRKNSSLVGSKFLIVDPMEKMEIDGCDRIVAVDDVGAGIGELVLVATGSAAIRIPRWMHVLLVSLMTRRK